MVGAARADQSGKAQEVAIGRSQVQVSVVLDNLRLTQMWIARKILELVQDFYTETRYITITEPDMFGSTDGYDDTADGPVLGINVPTDDGTILNDVTVGKYDIEIGYSPAGGNQRQITRQELMELRQLGVQVPDHVLVQYTDIPGRDDLVEFLKQAQGYGEPTEEEQQLAEMQRVHEIEMLRNQLEEAAAKVELLEAQAAEKKANAQKIAGYNEAELEREKMDLQRELKELDARLRIALAARSHENSQQLNDKRLASQIAIKSIDSISRKPTSQHKE
jgi:hypothetical protein